MGKKCLSKSRRWHGFDEKEEVCCQNNCWGQSLPLLKRSVLGATGWCWEWARFGPAFRQRHPGAGRAQSTCSVTARAVVQAGSVRRAGAAPVQDLTVSVAFWAAQVKRCPKAFVSLVQFVDLLSESAVSPYRTEMLSSRVWQRR